METNPGPRRPVLAVYRILYSNVLGLAGNCSDLTMASSRYDILLCSETLISDMHHVCELLLPGLGRLVLCAGTGCIRPDGWRYTYQMDMSISPTQISVWLLRNAGFMGFWCESELLYFHSLRQP